MDITKKKIISNKNNITNVIFASNYVKNPNWKDFKQQNVFKDYITFSFQVWLKLQDKGIKSFTLKGGLLDSPDLDMGNNGNFLLI